MGRHKYKFTDKHNTTGGTVSLLFGLMAAGLMAWALYMAYRERGNGGTDMGIVGTLSFLVSTIGLIMGLSSFKEEDRFYAFSWIGTILCGLIWVMLCAVVVIGL